MTQKIKNIAIVAHVDHGKTTLVDGLLKQSGTFTEREEVKDRVMDSGELERERGITISAKNCAISWKDTKVNLLDTPGHADFGGEVERSLLMVDGILLLVDASEGPLPQTRFVLEKALKQNLKVGVLINKIDRPDERIDEVKTEVEDLLLELASSLNIDDFDLDIPFLYASAKEGWATTKLGTKKEHMHDILDFIVSDYYPLAQFDTQGGFQLLVSNLSYSNFLGPLVIGRIQRGSIQKNQNYICIAAGDKKKSFKASSLQVFDKLGTKEVTQADAGEIILLAGLADGKIGDTLCAQDAVEALPRIDVDPPTVSVYISVNTSPLSGKEGEYLTSRKLEEFLQDCCRHNVALQFETTDDPKVYQLKGRGELQLAIVFEELRRKGFEFMVSRPEVLFQTHEGRKTEPFEKIVLDIPPEFVGAVTQELAERKGIMEEMQPLSEQRTRLKFVIPSRGLIGYRSKFLTDTKGEGIMSSEYLGYRDYAGDLLARQNGAIIADRSGKMTPYALFNLLNLGEQFVVPGEPCYEGQVIGLHNKTNDTNVNAIREKHLSSVRTAGKDVNIVLPPVQPRTIEWAIDWIDNDEWVEITPQAVRIRKKVLDKGKRSVIRR